MGPGTGLEGVGQKIQRISLFLSLSALFVVCKNFCLAFGSFVCTSQYRLLFRACAILFFILIITCLVLSAFLLRFQMGFLC